MINNNEYFTVLSNIKNQIVDTKKRVITNANKEVILMYYNIGKIIIEKNKWGNKFIESLSKDLRLEFPGIKGVSERNLRYMQKLAKEFPDCLILQRTAAELPWRSIMILLDKVEIPAQRDWYIKEYIKNKWSGNILTHQIATNLYSRQALLKNKTTNFKKTLPKPISKVSLEMLKDPYIFDFISYEEGMREKNIEDALVSNVAKLLLEFGNGFAFIGRQYHIVINDEDYYIDLLFYNLDLKCYVVIELKIDSFIPEYAGKLTFYLNAIDKYVKNKADNPTIGILLCKKKNNITAELALKDVNKPIGITEYKYVQEVPNYLEKNIPQLDTIKNRLLKE